MTAMRVLIVGLGLVTPLLGSQVARADNMVSFATAGYASGLRTMETMHTIDTDGDGMVSLKEWIAFQNRVFSALDKDHTGFIDAAEFYGSDLDMTPVAPETFIRGLRTREMFMKIGPNAQGKISRAEYLGFQQKIFEMMDEHHRDNLSPTDFILKKD